MYVPQASCVFPGCRAGLGATEHILYICLCAPETLSAQTGSLQQLSVYFILY